MSSKNFINIKYKNDRVVVLVDMDCFYCQVEEYLNPELRGKPIAVVQYNPFQGGGIIAVNYPARANGVKRGMRGDEARQLCPDIELPQVPCVRGKADISKYRDAGKLVADVLQTFTPLLERASIDEAYLDITQRVTERLKEMHEGRFKITPNKLENTFAVGYDQIGEYVQEISASFSKRDEDSIETEEDLKMYNKSNLKLLIGATIVNEIRAAVKLKTSYECSAGIAHNKILAKLTAGFHKPNKQTILPLKSIPTLYDTLSLKKVKGLGGKLGDQLCQSLKVETMGQLLDFTEQTLQKHSDERMGSWLYLMARGIDLEAVTPKYNPKSIGCCKRFPGKNAIMGLSSLQHWLGELANEVCERLNKDLIENSRTAKNMTVSYALQIGQEDISSTRTFPLTSYEEEKISKDALDAMRRNIEPFLKGEGNSNLYYPVKFLGISASKFEDDADKGSGKQNNIMEMFSNISKKKTPDGEEIGEPSTAQSENSTNKSFFKTLQQQNGETSKKNSENEPKKEVKSFFLEHFKKMKENQNPPDKKQPEMVETVPTKEVEGDPYDDDTLELPGDEENEKPSTSKEVPEYMKSYAEFYRAPAVLKVKCEECGQMIPENEVESHQDFHVALNVSRQQREDFRKVLKKEKSPRSSDENKNDITKLFKNHSKKPVEDIEETNEPEDSETPPNDGTYEEDSELQQEENDNFEDRNEEEIENDEPEIEEQLVVSPSPPEAILTCEECGKKLPESKMQSHLDFHIAFQLSQQQREEFRKEIKGKIQTHQSQSQSPAQKAKTNKQKVPKNQSLAKFLVKSVSTPLDDTQKCPECGRKVPSNEFTEHADYHAAKKLQIELNKLDMKTVTSNNFSVSNSSKRKRPGENLSPAPKIKSVSSYFSKT